MSSVKTQTYQNLRYRIITHDIKCAEVTGDRLLVLHDGRIIAEGTFDELNDHPDEEVRLFFNQ